MKKIYYYSILLLVVAILFTGLISSRLPNRAHNNKASSSNQEVEILESSDEIVNEPIEEVSYLYVAESDGQTVLELLEEKAEVVSTKSDLGVLVDSINGISSDAGRYWSFYVNDQLSMSGADSTELKKGDVVEWRYEKF